MGPCGAASTSGRAGATSEALVSLEEVQVAARRRGMSITVKDLGPFYRVVCRDASSQAGGSSSSGSSSSGSSSGSSSSSGSISRAGGQQEAKKEEGEGEEGGRVLGVTTGFVAPLLGIMHCDTLQIFTKGLKGGDGQRVRGGALGLGLLLGGATFAYGHARGCRTAEILAINDDDSWHERLVKYYSYFGFKPVCKVGGNGLSDLPHMLVWGGEGTRMDADITAMLRKWTPALRRTAAGVDAGGRDGDGEGGGEAAEAKREAEEKKKGGVAAL
ncbi:hypothetical protein HXX76_009807 [Chlamydomonas incerta]|uniref:Uncharacterized protein n=1 Tax=Chlamydomonas incerta TaxID=51695 RepID=A0A835SVW3_CHLIN|nr:hypothetical protein HXX76_009807 [Chlamydomonas incerta]|eukprot:KAG2430833.1 hypothetical protein HXX76_009807 [Chlamydomonas incerta]